MLINPGDIVRVNRLSPVSTAPSSGSVCVVIYTRQRYWDYGEGECGFVDVADVMSGGQIFEIACAFLEPINK